MLETDQVYVSSCIVDEYYFSCSVFYNSQLSCCVPCLTACGYGRPVKNLKDMCICFRTAKGNPPVTFAIAACETQNVSVTVLPSFGLSEGSGVTAKDMWDKMVQVRNLSFYSLLWG